MTVANLWVYYSKHLYHTQQLPIADNETEYSVEYCRYPASPPLFSSKLSRLYSLETGFSNKARVVKIDISTANYGGTKGKKYRERREFIWGQSMIVDGRC